MLKRYYDKNLLNEFLGKHRVIIITGPRQAGKTTLVRLYAEESGLRYLYVTGDDIRAEEILSSRNLKLIREFVAGYELVIIDEAQKIRNIGESVKLAVDNISSVRFILTGSSSFELSNKVGEPLTGRKISLNLFCVSVLELKSDLNDLEIKERLSDFMVFGMYPRVLIAENKKDKIEYINEITNSYLLKDILKFEGIKKSNVILQLLRALAFQIGSEVSLNELANTCGVDVKTVKRYIDLLEKSYIIYSLSAFSRNLRKEMSKKKKYYFYDNGIINSLISNFNTLDLRDDIGRLWENFVFMERLKKVSYLQDYSNLYFWRTWDKYEIDLVEEKDGRLSAYEFKFGEESIRQIEQWKQIYSSEIKLINKSNFIDFVG